MVPLHLSLGQENGGSFQQLCSFHYLGNTCSLRGKKKKKKNRDFCNGDPGPRPSESLSSRLYRELRADTLTQMCGNSQWLRGRKQPFQSPFLAWRMRVAWCLSLPLVICFTERRTQLPAGSFSPLTETSLLDDFTSDTAFLKPFLDSNHANVDSSSPPPPPLLHPATQRECEVSLSEEMKDGKKWVFGDQFFGDIDSAILFSLSAPHSLSRLLPLPCSPCLRSLLLWKWCMPPVIYIILFWHLYFSHQSRYLLSVYLLSEHVSSLSGHAQKINFTVFLPSFFPCKIQSSWNDRSKIMKTTMQAIFFLFLQVGSQDTFSNLIVCHLS